MKKNWQIKKGMVLGIILVLLGAGVVSSTAITMQQLSNSEAFGIPDSKTEGLQDFGKDALHVEYISSIPTTYDPTKVFVLGNYAYVTSLEWPEGSNPHGALDIINIANPKEPWIEGTLSFNPYTDEMRLPVGIYVQGNYAYVADVAAMQHHPSYLYQIDISNQSNPFIINKETSFGNSRGVFCQGEFAYEASMDGGLMIYQIDDYSPGLYYRGHCYTQNTAVAVFVLDNYAYVADFMMGGSSGPLTIVDVSNPENPVVVGSCRTHGQNPLSVWVVKYYSSAVRITSAEEYDLYAFVADMDGLQVFNVNDPENIFRVTHYDIPGTSRWVHVQGTYAYVASEERIEIVDISNPENPTQAGYYTILGDAMGISVKGNLIFVADGAEGLHILRFPGNAAELLTNDP